MADIEFSHVPVMLSECMDGLCIDPKGIYVDGTLGGGGHSYEICRRLTDGKLIGIDRDAAAIEAAGERLREYGSKAVILRANYTEMKERLRELGVDKVNGILLDLGVSSYQLDTIERGFTYKYDGPLDMRMDQRQQQTAKELINTCSEAQLYQIIRDYGEERYARNIARQIVKARNTQPVETTGQLTDIIRQAIPKKAQFTGGHPAKKTFQAIRIALNDELGGLERSLEEMISLLAPQGRICIISFHSLEDRIVKNTFRRMENPCTCPKEFPVCICGKVSQGRVITRKPILPGEEEMQINKRAKSAKLRIFEHI